MPTRTYDVYIAEPVPDLMYRLEFRYLETQYQEGSDWITYTVSENEDALDDGILWIALHLVAEWRVTEFVPTLDWEKLGTYSSHSTAASIADSWRELGFMTRVVMRYNGKLIDTSQLELQVQTGF